MGNHRKGIFSEVIKKTSLSDIVTTEALNHAIFDVRNSRGLYGLFQHAVHLITVERIEIKTSPENFNFIFKNPNDDDVYGELYSVLPMVLLYLAHVIMVLYDRIRPMDPAAKAAFVFRTINGYRLLSRGDSAVALTRALNEAFASRVNCAICRAPLKVTQYNAARLLLTDSFRCTRCRHRQPFPLSWMF